MTLRTRLTLWYVGILILSLLVIGIGTYEEISEQLRHDHRRTPSEHAVDETSELVFPVGLPPVIWGLLGGWGLTRRALASVTGLMDAIKKSTTAISVSRCRARTTMTSWINPPKFLTTHSRGWMIRSTASANSTWRASHELKTPLTVLCGETEIALRGESWTDSHCWRRPTPDKWLYSLSPFDWTSLCATILPTRKFSTNRTASKLNWKSAKKFPFTATGIACGNYCSTWPTTRSNTINRKAV